MSLNDIFYRIAAERGMLNSQQPDHLRTLPSPGSTAYNRMSDEQKAAVEAERERRTNMYNYEQQYNAGAHQYGTNPMHVFNNPDMYTEEERREAAMHAMSMNEAGGQDPFSDNTRWSDFGNITPEEYAAYKERQDAYRGAYENPYAADGVSWSQGFEGGYDFTQTPGYRGPINQSGLGFGHSQSRPTYTGGGSGAPQGGSGAPQGGSGAPQGGSGAPQGGYGGGSNNGGGSSAGGGNGSQGGSGGPSQGAGAATPMTTRTSGFGSAYRNRRGMLNQ